MERRRHAVAILKQCTEVAENNRLPSLKSRSRRALLYEDAVPKSPSHRFLTIKDGKGVAVSRKQRASIWAMQVLLLSAVHVHYLFLRGVMRINETGK